MQTAVPCEGLEASLQRGRQLCWGAVQESRACWATAFAALQSSHATRRRSWSGRARRLQRCLEGPPEAAQQHQLAARQGDPGCEAPQSESHNTAACRWPRLRAAAAACGPCCLGPARSLGRSCMAAAVVSRQEPDPHQGPEQQLHSNWVFSFSPFSFSLSPARRGRHKTKALWQDAFG